MWRHVAGHRVHRYARGHREDPHPSRRAQGQLHRPPPRTAAPCPASATPGIPITAPILTAPAGAPQPRCASSPASFCTIAFLTGLHDGPRQIASPRPRFICSRADIEPDNGRNDAPATISITRLFYLSFRWPGDASIATKARTVPFDAETARWNLGRARCCVASAASGPTPARWSPATGRALHPVGRRRTQSTPHRKSSWPPCGSTTRRRGARHCPTPTTNPARGAPCRRSSD